MPKGFFKLHGNCRFLYKSHQNNKGKAKTNSTCQKVPQRVKWRRFGAFVVLSSALTAQNSCFQNVLGWLEQEEEEDFTLFLLCGIQHGFAVTRKKCVFCWVEQQGLSDIKVLRFACNALTDKSTLFFFLLLELNLLLELKNV